MRCLPLPCCGRCWQKPPRSPPGREMDQYAPPPIEPDVSCLGMTLRDYFAAAALGGMCSSLELVAKMDAEERARYAYVNADAMLAEREKK